jgi:hypothetical protein
VTRDHVAPTLLVFGLFAFGVLLVVAGYRDRFEDVTHRSQISPELADRVLRIHQAASDRTPSDTAARAIASDAPTSFVEIAAYRILFEIAPTRTAGVILAEGSFQRGSDRVRGWEDTADVVFGARSNTLTDAELALYCHWVVSGQEGWSPDEMMLTRQQLLTRLLSRHVIDRSTYETMSAQPLVLRPTPIPIY